MQQTQGQAANQQRGSSNRIGHVNYTNLKEIPEGEPILAGTFSLQHQPVVVFFGSGASRNFVSKCCKSPYTIR